MFLGKVVARFQWDDPRMYGKMTSCGILDVEPGHIVVRVLYMDTPHYREQCRKLLALRKVLPVEAAEFLSH